MDKVKNSPSPLRRKLLFTCIVGVACMLVGLAMFLFLKDRMMLFLSLVICVFSFGKAFNIYRVIAGEEYEVVEGTCVAITPKPLRKYRKKMCIRDSRRTVCSIKMWRFTAPAEA